MERDKDIQMIVQRLQAIPGLRDLEEMFEGEDVNSIAIAEAASIAKMELLKDAKALLAEL